MRILVTGGAGFLGSHLCDRLINDGHDVLCMDNFFTGRLSNVSHLLENPHFQLIEHDVTQPYDYPVDQIYNLACPASPPHYQLDPVLTTKISFFGALHALELGKKYQARVFQASTSEVYGDPEIHPQPESYRGCVNPIGIRACYDEGKRVAETLFFDFHRQYGTEIRVVRIFNTYGPRMRADDGRVVSNFIIQALKNETITMYGDGTQTRSFCYVDDLIDGFVRLMNAPNITGPINIGNPGEFSMLELADLISEKVGNSNERSFLPLPGDDPKQRKPDITLAQQQLGWEPKIAIQQGLDKTIAHFAKELKEGIA